MASSDWYALASRLFSFFVATYNLAMTNGLTSYWRLNQESTSRRKRRVSGGGAVPGLRLRPLAKEVAKNWAGPSLRRQEEEPTGAKWSAAAEQWCRHEHRIRPLPTHRRGAVRAIRRGRIALDGPGHVTAGVQPPPYPSPSRLLALGHDHELLYARGRGRRWPTRNSKP